MKEQKREQKIKGCNEMGDKIAGITGREYESVREACDPVGLLIART